MTDVRTTIIAVSLLAAVGLGVTLLGPGGFGPIAGLGLILIVGGLIGELLALVHLPRVLGFIAAGMVAGLEPVGLVHLDAGGPLEPLFGLAWAVAAFMVGSRYRFEAIGALGTRPWRRLGIGLVLMMTLVAAAALMLGLGFQDLADEPARMVVALVLIGLVLVAPSAPQLLAVGRGRGGSSGEVSERFTALLSQALAIELLAVITVAGVVVTSSVVFAAPGEPVEPLLQVAIALLVGGVAAFAIDASVRLSRDLNLLAIGLAIVGAQAVCVTTGAPTVLALGLTGLMVAQRPSCRALVEAIWSRSWLPLAVFFALLGATLPVQPALLAPAVALVVLRGVALRVAGLAARAGRSDDEAKPDGRSDWSFVAQGATALVLIQAVRPWIPAGVAELLFDVVLINLLIGPVAIRAALAERVAVEHRVAVATPADEAEPLPKKRPTFESGELNEVFERLERVSRTLLARFEEEIVDAQTTGLTEFLEQFRTAALSGLERIEQAVRAGGPQSAETLDTLRGVRSDLYGWLRRASDVEVDAQEERVRAAKLRAYLSRLEREIEPLPALFVLVEPERYAVQPGDRPGTRIVKLLRRVRRRLGIVFGGLRRVERRVPMRDLAAHYLARPLGTDIRVAANALAVQRIDLWRHCRAIVDQLSDVFGFALGEWDEPPTAEQLVKARLDVTGEFEAASRDLWLSGDRVIRRLLRRVAELLAETGQAATLAGTLELPNRRYSMVRVIEQRQIDRRAITAEREEWHLVVRATAASLIMRLHGETVLAEAARVYSRFTKHIESQILGPLNAYPEEVRDQIRDAADRIRSVIESQVDAETEHQLLEQERAFLEGFVARIAVGETAAAMEPAQLSKPFDSLVERLERVLLDLPESYPTRRDPWQALGTHDPPDVGGLRDFPFRELCREVLQDEVRLSLIDRQKDLGLLLRDAVDELTELAHFVAFNFEAGDKALLDGAVEKGNEVVLNGLREAQERVERLMASGTQRSEELRRELTATLRDQSDSLRDVLAGLDYDEALRRSGLVGALERPDRDEVEDAERTWIGRLLDGVLTRYNGARQRFELLLGVPQSGGPRVEERRAVAGRTDEAPPVIPTSYRRLFETAAFGVEDILAGQELELDILDTAIQRWRNGESVRVVVVGEWGAGRTTLIERALRRFLSDAMVHRRQIQERVYTEAELATELSQVLFGTDLTRLDRVSSRLDSLGQPQICLLQELQQAMLRTYDGLDSIVSLLDFINQSPQQVLWLCTVDAAAWRFLHTFLNAAQHFSHVVEIGRLSREETEQLVLRRHRVSGYQLAFRLQEAGERTRFFRRSRGADHKQYFEALHRVSRGHPVSTMLAWLDSIVAVDADTITLTWPRDSGDVATADIESDQLLNLASVMMHGSLTEAELALVARLSRREAASQLGQLRALNLIDADAGGGDAYVVRPAYYRSLFDHLRQRRMI